MLVVDDDEDVRRLLALLFESEGFDAATAEDGLEAIELAEAYQPDVVTLDWDMPLMSGIDAARRLRRALPTALIVMFTGRAGDDRRASAVEAGADDLVDKGGGPLPLLAFAMHHVSTLPGARRLAV